MSASSAGSAMRKTDGKPSAASPRAPRKPVSRYSLSPKEPAVSARRERKCASIWGAAIRPARAQIFSASASKLRRQAAAEAARRPSEKMAPLCAFTPPVAFSMVFSASMPSARRVGNASASSSFIPARAHSRKYGFSERALRSSISRLISGCDPLFRRSTRPGFGVVSASRISARTAASEMRSGSVSRRHSSILRETSFESSGTECARLRAHSNAGFPHRRQLRGGSPSAERQHFSPFLASTSRSNSRPSGSSSSMRHISRLTASASAFSGTYASGPVNASYKMGRAPTALCTRRTPSRNAARISVEAFMGPGIFIVRQISTGDVSRKRFCRSARRSRASSISATVTGRAFVILIAPFCPLFYQIAARFSTVRLENEKIARKLDAIYIFRLTFSSVEGNIYVE